MANTELKIFAVFVTISIFQIPSVKTSTRQQQRAASWCPGGYQLANGALDICKLMSCLNFSTGRIPANVPSNAQQFTSSKNMTLVCAQLTSIFNQCVKTTLSPTDYRIFANDSRLQIRETNTFVPLGEFVFSLSTKTVSVCGGSGSRATRTAPTSLPVQCMPFKLPSERCHLMPDGHLSAINGTLNLSPAFFHFDPLQRNYDLCYGMSHDFVICPQLGGIPINYSKTLPDLTLYTDLNIVETYPLGSYAWTKDGSNAVVCIEPTSLQPQNQVMAYLIGVSMIASAIFLFVTLLAHLLFPSLNYHAKPLLCHIISLLVMYISTAVRLFHPMYDTTDIQCYTLFSFSYVSTLGAFCWLSVLAFDLWRVFANLRPTVSPVSTPGKRRKFALQCIYAWGTPIALCIVALIVTRNKNIQDALNLQFPLLNLCWFATNKSIFAFMYAPIIAILIGNVIFFVLTVINLHKASKGTNILNKKVSRQLFKIFGKLFVVMGLFWFAEFISWVFRREDNGWSYPTDLLNSLQGVVIFFVYVFKRKTLIKIKEKLGFSDTSNGTRSTSGRKKTTTAIELNEKHRKTEMTLSTFSDTSVKASSGHNLNTIT